MVTKKYLICDNNCKFEGLDKEETLSAIQQAIEQGGVQNVDPNEPFITKIKDKNTGASVSVWVGTEAQFNAIETKEENTLYIFNTDFEDNVNKLFQEIIDGVQKVGHATNAENATNAEKSNYAEKANYATSAGTATSATNASNATKVNNLEIKKDSNGVLKIGDVIIPQKRLIWSGTETNGSSNSVSITPTKTYSETTTKEIVIEKGTSVIRVRTYNGTGGDFLVGKSVPSGSTETRQRNDYISVSYYSGRFTIASNQYVYEINPEYSLGYVFVKRQDGFAFTVKEIYEIIE